MEEDEDTRRLRLPRYKMDASPKGICVIFNNATFRGRSIEGNRKGTEHDRDKLIDTFEELGFIVNDYQDYTGDEIKEKMKELSKLEHKAYDCFVCCILSHGERGKIFGSDMEPVEIDNIMKMMLPDECPSLKGKPKLFFIQACRGKDNMTGFRPDAMPEYEFADESDHSLTIPNQADLLICHSTSPGYTAWRDEREGSWYIGELTKMLKQYAESNDIGLIMRGLNNRVGMEIADKMFKQAPVFSDSLRKLLIFKGEDTKVQRRKPEIVQTRPFNTTVSRMHETPDTLSSDGPPDKQSTIQTHPRLLQMLERASTKDWDWSGMVGKAAQEAARVAEAVDEARKPEIRPAPKARSFDTVLCLDTSESMKRGSAFEDMIECVHEFLNGVEEIVRDSGVEEDIALVTFGGSAKVVQHLTNDFARIREAIEHIKLGGKSPFFEAVMVCLATIAEEGGTVSVSRVYEVKPRIIFITDGHITESSDDPTDSVTDSANTRGRFSRLMMDLNSENQPVMPHPIVFVPVGENADKELLKAMATLNKSPYIESKNIKKLCGYFRVQATIGKLLVILQHKKQVMRANEIEALVHVLAPKLDGNDVNVVVRAVREEMSKPEDQKKRKNDPTDFNNLYENTDLVKRGDSLPLGTRVVRGPDWQWDAQDNYGPGTVIQHEEGEHPLHWVMWDSGEFNCYTYDPEIGFHVWKTDAHPRLKTEDGELQIGMTVKKGSHGTERGTVVRKSKNGNKLKVRWSNGRIQDCLSHDLVYSDPFVVNFGAAGNWAVDEAQGNVGQEEDEGDGVVVWKWEDSDGNWQDYQTHTVKDLEKAYQRKKDGSCIIQRGGKSFRVFFEKMVERTVGSETPGHRNVKRMWDVTKADDVEQTEDTEDGKPAWQWQDVDGDWQNYSPHSVQNLEETYQGKKTGSCIVERDGKKFSVFFDCMVEKADGAQAGGARDVRRVLLPVETEPIAEEKQDADEPKTQPVTE